MTFIFDSFVPGHTVCLTPPDCTNAVVPFGTGRAHNIQIASKLSMSDANENSCASLGLVTGIGSPANFDGIFSFLFIGATPGV